MAEILDPKARLATLDPAAISPPLYHCAAEGPDWSTRGILVSHRMGVA